MHHVLTEFVDPTSPVFGVTSAAAFGALSLVDPARLSPVRRRAYRVGLAATTGLWAGLTTDRDRTVLVPAHVVAGLLAGGAVWASAEVSETADERVVGWLQAAGVARPRWWLAAASAGSVLASVAADRAAARRAAAGTDPEVWREDLMRTRPITSEVREVVEAILQAADTPEAQVLRGQWAVAQESCFDDGEEFSTMVEFEVPDDVVRVVPHSHTYPVHARFHAPEGTELQVSLQIFAGRLVHVAIEAVDEDHPKPVDDILDRWPPVTDLRFVREAIDGRCLPLP